ncbi:MAG: gliding motility-associated C-terminal domain-containing protein, partial [Crocinitomicaceae bacterium]|nr:gliding motility-associated C-terminal domain-containing protein [Crocinitomicaceae bacterium]
FWCADTAISTIHVYPPVSIFIPNVITANEDNINDDFTIQLEGGEYIWWTILNRWGQTVYENEKHIDTSLASFDLWDGIHMYMHQPVSEGVYFYRIVVKSPVGTTEIYTGNVTVLR